MDSTTAITERISKLVANRRVRAFSIGVLVLAVLALLQVNNLKRHTPMVDLLSNSKLCNADVQRIQIALSQSGLGDYQLQDNRLMVPVAQHSIYLQAVAEQNAIPEELRQSDDDSRPSINPFLSRSQQLAIDRAAKKQQVRDMVLRLQFVEQAWFEMDKSDSHSAFEQAEQSAVISIRTPENVSLSDQDVDTVKLMIGGAVAGLGSDNIVVIDLNAGYAHHDHLDPSTTRQVHFQRIAIEQQRFYENQIRKILKDYPGIKVSVHVDVKPTPESDSVASVPNPIPVQAQSNRIAPLPSAGANSFASIEQIPTLAPPTDAPSTVELISFSTSVESPESLEKQISVSIDVPQKLVHDLFGAPPMSSSFANGLGDLQAKMTSDTNAKFEQLRSEIIQKISPILPRSDLQNAVGTPITVSLIRAPLPETSQWFAQLKDFVIQNWPSAAVLLIGLMLLSIVARKPDTYEPTADRSRINESGDILSINSSSTAEPGATENPEAKLTKLIERDPDAAARVIEAWIRDAA